MYMEYELRGIKLSLVKVINTCVTLLSYMNQLYSDSLLSEDTPLTKHLLKYACMRVTIMRIRTYCNFALKKIREEEKENISDDDEETQHPSFNELTLPTFDSNEDNLLTILKAIYRYHYLIVYEIEDEFSHYRARLSHVKMYREITKAIKKCERTLKPLELLDWRISTAIEMREKEIIKNIS